MTQAQPQRTTSDLVKAAVSGWLGTALEFMDFQLYSLGAALVFHEIFFPEQSAAMALILAMGTYGAGYIARIVGAFIFGRMGDSIGRKKVLFITITMMGICTTLIGVLPTYAQIGLFAPVLLVTLRIIPGLGAGAALSGAGTMLAEYAPQGKRGIISSLVAMGTNCGTLSATAIWAVMFFALDREQLLAWGWRVPFLASVVVMIFAIWLRMNLKESPVFEKVNDAQTAQPDTSLGAMVKSKSFWLATGLRFGQAGNSGLIQTFLAGYLVQTLLFDKAIPTDALMISSRCWAGCPIKWDAVCRTLSLIFPPLFWRTRCCRSSSIKAMRREPLCSPSSLSIISRYWGCLRWKISPWRRCLAREIALPGWLSPKRRAVWWQWGLVRCWRGSSVT